MSSYPYLGIYTDMAGNPVKKGLVEGKSMESFNALWMKYVRDSTWLSGGCRFQSRDPMDDMVAAMNELMFRARLMSVHWRNTTSLIDPRVVTHQAPRLS
jgi:hypothetical protein